MAGSFYIEMLIVISLKLSICCNSTAKRLPDEEFTLVFIIKTFFV